MGAVTVGAFPGFFIAILMILIFSGFLGIFPAGGLASGNTLAQYGSREGINWGLYFTADFAWHYVLPFATVVLRFFYTPTLTMRTSVNEVSNQDFMYYHKISGLPGLSRLRRLIRHASLPVITLYPVSMTRAISGLVLIEMVFNWPGIGFTLVQSVFARDYPVVQFVFFITAVVVIFGNLLIDILYGVIDPRVTLGEGES
jgi:peptide/nickel transport system permease protein